MDRPDRRVVKTKAAAYQALNDLMQKKKYANITIQEIIDRANIGRTTFYSHFIDKDDLLSNYIETIFDSFNGNLTKYLLPEHDNHFICVADLFTHVQENYCFINGVLMSESGERLMNRFRNYYGKKIEPYILGQLPKGKQPKVPIDILTNYVAGTLTELIRWWIKSGEKYTPEQMEKYFEALIFPTIQLMVQN